MKMELFSGMLRELLLRDGCVELPTLGWLYFITCPASVSDRGFTVNPPFRRLVFSSSMPGSLSAASASSGSSDCTPSIVKFYAEANGLSVKKAADVIIGTVSSIDSLVSSSRDFLLPGLGRFKRMRDGTLFFVQDQELELCPAFDLLPSLSLKSHSGDSLPEPSEAVSRDADPSKPEDAPSEAVIAPEPSEAGLTGGKSRRRYPRALKPLAICSGTLLLAALLLLSAVAVVGRMAPEVIDSYLYTHEQLDVLRGNF